LPIQPEACPIEGARERDPPDTDCRFLILTNCHNVLRPASRGMERRMSDTKIESGLTAEHCRTRAREMLNLARWTVNPTDKLNYLDLAENWLRLAERAETYIR
jgi:hypothetical protein